MDDIPYLARGVNLLGTDSSLLVSNSKYLNSPKLREWIALHRAQAKRPRFPARRRDAPAARASSDELRDYRSYRGDDHAQSAR